MKTIHIGAWYFRPNVANAMIQLKHLSKIEVLQKWRNYDDDEDEDEDEDEDDCGGIIQFLKHHVEMGHQSTLEELVMLRGTPDVAWIPLAPELKRLKKLKLITDRIPGRCFPLIISIGKGCPALEKLILGLPNSMVADGLLKPLRVHPNLECLKIGTGSLSADDAIALCTFRNLKKLQLECHVSDDLLEMLQDHIQTIEMYPRRW